MGGNLLGGGYYDVVNCDFTNHMGGKSIWGGNLFSSGEGGAPEVLFFKSANDIH